MNKVVAKLACPYLVIKQPDTDAKMIRLFSRMAIVISMRLHALVFAAGQGVPLLGVVYDPKVNGFMEYLGQKNYVPLEGLTAEKLAAAVETTLHDGVPTQAAVLRLCNLAAENESYLKKLLEA